MNLEELKAERARLEEAEKEARSYVQVLREARCWVLLSMAQREHASRTYTALEHALYDVLKRDRAEVDRSLQPCERFRWSLSPGEIADLADYYKRKADKINAQLAVVNAAIQLATQYTPEDILGITKLLTQ